MLPCGIPPKRVRGGKGTYQVRVKVSMALVYLVPNSDGFVVHALMRSVSHQPAAGRGKEEAGWGPVLESGIQAGYSNRLFTQGLGVRSWGQGSRRSG